MSNKIRFAFARMQDSIAGFGRDKHFEANFSVTGYGAKSGSEVEAAVRAALAAYNGEAPADSDALVPGSDHVLYLANAMEEFGGSFAGHIARAYYCADKQNKAALVQAFGHIFKSYESFVARKAAQAVES